MALRLIGLTRRYGGRPALDAVSVHVRPGDCYGFLGHNGAGKTTTMRVALGLERADAGRVVVDGFDAAEFPREARARMGGLIETPGFHGHIDGAANLATLARLQGFDRRGARAEAARLVEAVGLGDVGSKPVRAYSQGMRQRLGIAQALIGSPKIVLLDEPMSGLDPEGIEEIRRLLVRLTRDEGMTVLLSSHQLHEIAGLCNRIGILRKGRMLVEEETSKLFDSEAGRYELATTDDAQAARILASAGVTAAPRAAGGLDASLGARAPEEVSRVLVAGGVGLRAWTPRPPSLEEIYLRFTQGREPDQPSGDAGTEGDVRPVPERRLAPARPVARVWAYDVRRQFSTLAVPAMLALPAVVAVVEIAKQHARVADEARQVAAGTLATASQITGFEAVGVALQSAFPVLGLLVAGLASQSIAGEDARGTLRNLLLRPTTRVGVVVGKTLAALFVALVAFAVLHASSMVAADATLGFRDVVEILPNGKTFVFEGGAADKISPEMVRTFALLLPVLAAFAGVGMLAGALTRSGAAGLAVAIAGAAGLEFFGRWDHDVLQSFVETARVNSNALRLETGYAVVAPLACLAATVAASAWLLRRRSIR